MFALEPSHLHPCSYEMLTAQGHSRTTGATLIFPKGRGHSIQVKSLRLPVCLIAITTFTTFDSQQQVKLLDGIKIFCVDEVVSSLDCEQHIRNENEIN